MKKVTILKGVSQSDKRIRIAIERVGVISPLRECQSSCGQDSREHKVSHQLFVNVDGWLASAVFVD